MKRRSQKNRAQNIVLLAAAVWFVFCMAVAFGNDDTPREYPEPLPLCIDAPEYTCVIPAQDSKWEEVS